MNSLTIAAFLVVVNNRLIEGLWAPVKVHYPKLDAWWLTYVAWVTGGLLSWAAGINLFSAIVPSLNATVGQVLTAIVVGGGSNLLADLFPTSLGA